MNLRILKKQSKAARDILIAFYGYTPDRFFLAERGDNYHGYALPCVCGRRRNLSHREDARRDSCSWCSSHPLKGTPMTGEMSGYYEPEWDERTALEELGEIIAWVERPQSMTDAVWQRAQTLTGREPIDIDALIAADEMAFPPTRLAEVM